MATKTKTSLHPVVAKKQLSANNYIAAVAAASLLVVLICGLVVKGLAGSLVVNTKVIAGKAQAKNDLDTKLGNIPTLINNYNQLGTTKTLINDGMPTSSDFAQIIDIMQGIGAGSGVNITTISPPGADTSGSVAASTSTTPGASTGALPANSGPTPYTFTFAASGTYLQIVQCFKALELSVRPMHVQAVQIAGSNGTLTIQVTVQTYYQPKADINDKTKVVK